jgi:hypothetical protein
VVPPELGGHDPRGVVPLAMSVARQAVSLDPVIAPAPAVPSNAFSMAVPATVATPAAMPAAMTTVIAIPTVIFTGRLSSEPPIGGGLTRSGEQTGCVRP